MARTAKQIQDDLIKHSIFLEQLKAGQVLDFNKAYRDIEERIAGIISSQGVETLDELSRRELNDLLKRMEEAQREVLTAQMTSYGKELEVFAGYEAQWESDFIKRNAGPKSKKARKLKTPTAAQAYKKAFDNPIGTLGKDLEGWTSKLLPNIVGRVNDEIRNGWAQGKTTDEVLRAIVGTRKGKFRDGIMSGIRKDAETVVLTATAHVAQEARMATWEANSDLIVGYKIIATLDARTTDVCRAMDGKVFPLNGKSPRPPFHPRCRTTTIADLGDEFDFLDKGATRSSEFGYVGADLDYYDWLKQQDRGYVKDVLGKTRTDLFFNGGMTPDEYAMYGMNKRFKPLTLAQMAEKDPEPFKRAGLVLPK